MFEERKDEAVPFYPYSSGESCSSTDAILPCGVSRKLQSTSNGGLVEVACTSEPRRGVASVVLGRLRASRRVASRRPRRPRRPRRRPVGPVEAQRAADSSRQLVTGRRGGCIASVFRFRAVGSCIFDFIEREKLDNSRKNPSDTRLRVTVDRISLIGLNNFRQRGARVAKMRVSLRCLRGWHWWSVCLSEKIPPFFSQSGKSFVHQWIAIANWRK